MNDSSGASRPKIHRLPQSAVEEGEIYVSRTVIIICLAIVLVVLIPALLSFNKVEKNSFSVSMSKVHKTMKMPPAANDSTGIVVRDEAGKMVGHIAKMPSDIDTDNSIKTSAVTATPNRNKQDDNRELLAIIGKY